MILNDSLDAVIEAVYLKEPLTGQTGKANIQVNPSGRISYIAGKTIIISKLDYPEDLINELIDNGNTLIFRVPNKLAKEIHPYILRVDFNAMWNGQIIDEIEHLGDSISLVLDDNGIPEIFVPKVNNPDYKMLLKDNVLTSIGWLLQQIGQNVITETKFVNLDILKTKKVMF